MDFFSMKRAKEKKKNAPLADRMRPENLDQVFGHRDLIGPGRVLRRLIQADRVPSLLLYGPPGTGKTTLASVIAESTARRFVPLSAVTAGVKEIRQVVDEAKEALGFDGQRTILFLDEIHRFNKSQQDALLPHVEDGTLTLIGATTENPYFEVNKALLSRMQVLELKPLDEEALSSVLDRALRDERRGLGKEQVQMDAEARKLLFMISGGDARVLLNTLELAVLSTPPSEGKIHLGKKEIAGSVQKHGISYDKGAEEHYNNISAFIKSVRGSDPDAAVYYLARMLLGGEDPLFIARRLCILASEDVGNANPMALVVASSCFQACSKIGMPEARIILSQATTYLASSPKSNASYLAIDRAMEWVRSHGAEEIPAYLKDAHYSGAKELGRGISYKYPHDYPRGYVLQKYLPDAIINVNFYQPKDIGEERKTKEYLDRLKEIEEE